MKISELFRQLSFEELSNLSVGTDGTGSIEEQKYPQIAGYINEGLLRIYSKFSLLEKDVIIEQVAHITNYHLRPQFAESSNSDERYPYIKDLPDEPFADDVIRILEVHDSRGHEYVLNDKDDPRSLFTPQPFVLQVPAPQAGVALGVSYQARHPKIGVDIRDNDAMLDEEIDLPFTLEGALKSFIAYKVYSHMNGQENLLKSQEHNANFEGICAEIENRDLVRASFVTSHSKLQKRGFV